MPWLANSPRLIFRNMFIDITQQRFQAFGSRAVDDTQENYA
jgi:hypothetical protein